MSDTSQVGVLYTEHPEMTAMIPGVASLWSYRSKRLVNRDALIAEPRAFCVKSGLGGGEGFPVVWEQLLDPADRMRGHSREHIAEPGKRLDRIPLAHRDEA